MKLKGNDIGPKGISGLSEALKVNNTLTFLGLGDVPGGDEIVMEEKGC